MLFEKLNPEGKHDHLKRILILFRYGTKDQLKSLNLVYINYDVANPKAKGADKLKLFTSDTDDSNQNFAHALKVCVLDVLY